MQSQTAAKNTDGPDIRVTDHGSVLLIEPLTPAAKAWIDENVSAEPWQWFGPALAVEPRYAGALLDGAISDGLEVE